MDLRTGDLPLLPGYTFRDLKKRNFHRSQTLLYNNGYAFPINHTTPENVNPYKDHHKDTFRKIASLESLYSEASDRGIRGVNGFEENGYIERKMTPRVRGQSESPWDIKILKFDAYFKEDVENSQQEGFRIRKVNLYYYLEDDTIGIYEPPTENSGIRQGKILRRQKVSKNGGKSYWHWTDFNLGKTVQIYSVMYRILNCDDWTRNYLETNGVLLNDAEELPSDPYHSRRQQLQQKQKPAFITPPVEDKLWKFLNLDRQVLRFFCILEERGPGQAEQDTRPVLLQYYLVDDTLEIRECHQPNDGRDPNPIALKRQRVPKNGRLPATFLPIAPGVEEFLPKTNDDYLGPKDFGIGKVRDIFGRRILICDCDDFTKSFYRKYLGVEDFTPVKIQKPVETIKRQKTPPYNGYGSPEDSAQSCIYLTPRKPKKSILKFLENDTKVLRFGAVFQNPSYVDKTRKFIISFYLADDTISIYEPYVPNSGMIGGKFLERRKLTKPGTDLTHPNYYHFSDFYIGATIEASGWKFKLVDCDMYVVKYMQENAAAYSGEALELTKSHVRNKGNS